MFEHTPRTFIGATTFRVDDSTGRCSLDVVAEQIRLVPGVTDVRVDLATGAVTVIAERPVDRVDIAAAVTAAGSELRP